MFGLAHRLEQVLLESARVTPLDLFLRLGDLEFYGQPRTQHRLRPQHMLEPLDRYLVGIEILLVRPEADRRARIRFADRADFLELAALFAARETHVVFDAATANPDFEVFRKCVDDGDADAVQAAGILIVFLVEFSACVQARQDQFDTGNFFLGMNVDGHAAAIVADFDGAVSVNRDFNFLAMTCERFINAVVDDFVSEVIRPRSIRIHARPAADRLKTTQDLDVGRIVTFAHLLVCPKRKQELSGLNSILLKAAWKAACLL